MNWKRKLQKLRHLSADELRVRLRGILRQRRERRLYQRGAGKHVAAHSSAVRLTSRAARLVPGTQPESLASLRENHAESYLRLEARALESAEAILEGKWDSLGHRFDLSGGVDWHFDPPSDFSWPRCFYADIPIYDAGSNIDVKYVWELGRQQYVFTLASAWLLSGRNHFANHAHDVILSWISKNPLYEGVHWTSSLEVAVRSISWIWSLAALQSWDGWRADDLARIAASLAEHADYLEQHLSFYSSPYNHLIGEATGLLLIASVLDEHEAADRWGSTAHAVLCEHGPRQFYADGFCVEQATGYHFLTLGFLSMAIAAARLEEQPLAQLEAVVQRAFGAGAAFRQPNGCWPPIGDVDNARSIPVLHDDFWDFNSLCSLGAALFDDKELKTQEASTEAYWLLGVDAIETLRGMPLRAQVPTTVLSDSGYWIATAGSDWCLLDAGPIAGGLHADATPSTAHGHLDVLSVLYYSDGQPVLVDSGMPYYVGNAEWVGYFRGATAHNTIEIEGIQAARDAGQLAWSHVQFQAELHGSAGSAYEARGRVRLGNDVTLERYVLMLPEVGMWIADCVSLDEPRKIRWSWHTAAEVEESSEPPVIAHGPKTVLASWVNSTWHQTSIVRSDSESPQAWRSSGYGRLDEGTCVTEEVEDLINGTKVTFVGPELTPFQFVLDGEEHSHGWSDSLEGIIEVPSGAAIWRIAQKRFAKSVC